MGELKTALYEKHVEAEGKIVPFAGYLLPVQYKTGVITEHMAVREKAGLFDVSHMGEIMLEGAKALDFLQLVLCNDYINMNNGYCRYSPMCNENGGVVDDLIVYKFNDEKYMLVVNAANKDKDFAWLNAQKIENISLSDVSDKYSELALQGPFAQAVIDKICKDSLPVKGYTFVEKASVAGVDCIVSRTGYTGEDGFELYCENDNAVKLWSAILDAGEEFGILPCGLGARDTLRLEAGMPLYGHEMSDEITPIEANLGFFVKMDKENFIGKAALEATGKPSRRRTGLKITGRGIAREGAVVYCGEEQVGLVTSGTQLPFVGYAGAVALIDIEHREIGTQLIVDVRGRKIEAEVIKLPFYTKS